MTTKQLSDTNLVTRLYTQAELNLFTTSGITALSNVQTTKIKAGCDGKVRICAGSTGSVVVKVTTASTDVLSFAAPQTVTMTVNTNAWEEIVINGDTAKYWGIQVADASLLNKLVVEEASLLADGESISIVQAGFNAKHVSGTGNYSSTFV